MRDYGKVYSAFWSSPTIRGLSEDARHLALYLLTCPHGSIAGVFRLPDGYVCDDMQWGFERVSQGFSELFAKGFATRCDATKWVWIYKAMQWDGPDNPNQRKAAAKSLHSVPEQCAWKSDCMRVCGPLVGIYSTISDAVNSNRFETLPEPFATPAPAPAPAPEREFGRERSETANVVQLFVPGEQEGHQGAPVVDAAAPPATDVTPSPGRAADGPRKAPKPKPPPRDQARMPCADSRNPAERVLAFLNERANRRFPAADVNLDLVRHRLAEGYSEAQLRQVVAKKLRDWRQDPKMAAYLRPATLFGRTNLAQYVGELGVAHAGG